ncbi:MAG: hypothetical protein JRG80_09770 [Deltaproteobacteria bacterium]|nr:hypothetical protein [Deltaproteobacteria bacterium]MBW2399550.1 hypothetical protein [Deltaproteobacteria bacterium]
MKIEWQGEITSVQPRFRLLRSFDQRHHVYLGYALRVRGSVAGEPGEAWFGVGKVSQQKHQFEVGQTASGQARPVVDPRMESADFYKVSRLAIQCRQGTVGATPPWHGPAPPIETYRERGHRRLFKRTYHSAACSSCIWGARMPVEIVVDQWNPDQKRYRFETFCYGPKSCSRYRAGPTRKVPGRRGMTYEEEDWVDAELTAHRGADD